MKLRLPDWRFCLIALFLVAALVRVVFVLSLQPGFYFWDSVRYDNAAVSLLERGNFGDYNRSPIYPLFMAGIYAVAGHSVLSVRLVEAVLGAVIAVFLAGIGRRIAGPPTGLIAALIWTFYPLAVFLAGLVYPETLMTFLIALGVLLFLRWRDGGCRLNLFFSGMPLLVAVLIKPVVVATIIVLFAWLVFFAPKSRFRALGVFAAGLILPFVLWAGISKSMFGSVILTDPRSLRFVDKAGATNVEEVRKGRLQRAMEDPAGFVGNYFTEFANFWQIYPERVEMGDQKMRDRFHEKDSRVVKKTVFGGNSLTFWASVFSVGPVLLLALVGVGLMVRDRRLAEVALVVGITLSFALAYSFVFAQMRYRIPVEPYLMVLAGYSLAWLAERLFGFRFTLSSKGTGDRVVPMTAD